MTPEHITPAVDRLLLAARTGRPAPAVRDLLPPGDVDAAYAVQRAVNDLRREAGGTPVGRKIGLTSRAVQEQLGVDRPDFGTLFGDMLCHPGQPVPHARLMQPRVEAEIAFVLGADLDAPGPLDATRVASAVDHAVAALEIVDSRIAGWDITIVDTIADNASSGMFVLGATAVSLDRFDPATARMTMAINDRVVSTGTGAACLGDPLEALAWLARAARDVGDPLRAGEVVLSGALGPLAPVKPGDRVHADISGVGPVEVVFAPAPAVEVVTRSARA